MTDIANFKKRVIQHINSIVDGFAKDGINITRLNKEYKVITGVDIPYMQLGQSSLQNFLRSIPDVRFEIKACEIRIFPIADEKRAHVVKLCLSKTSDKSQRGGRSYNSRSYEYNNECLIQASIKNQGSVPASSRAKIENTLSLAGVDGVDIDDFQTNFSRYYGFNLDYRCFGFDSLMDCLKSIPKIVTLRGNSAGKTYCVSTVALESNFLRVVANTIWPCVLLILQ